METYGRWQTGQQILQQDLWRGKLLSSRPVTVVEDTPTRLALYTHPGSPYYSATAISRNRKALSLSERVDILMSDDIPPLERRVSGRSPCADSHSTWSGAFSVALLDPGVAFSVLVCKPTGACQKNATRYSRSGPGSGHSCKSRPGLELEGRGRLSSA